MNKTSAYNEWQKKDYKLHEGFWGKKKRKLTTFLLYYEGLSPAPKWRL